MFFCALVFFFQQEISVLLKNFRQKIYLTAAVEILLGHFAGKNFADHCIVIQTVYVSPDTYQTVLVSRVLLQKENFVVSLKNVNN